MKKLVIIAGVALMAIASNAATFSWTLTNVYGPDGATLVDNSYKAYLFTSAAVATSSWSKDADIAALTAKGYELTWADAGKYSDSSKTVTTDNINAASQLNIQGGNSYDFYAVIVNSAKDAYYMTPTKANIAVSGGTDNTLISFASQKTATMVEGGAWTSTAAPEPTSGLLLLLGVAGLALKRKIA